MVNTRRVIWIKTSEGAHLRENHTLYLDLHENIITPMRPSRGSKCYYHCLQYQTEIIPFIPIYQLLLGINHSTKHCFHNVYIQPSRLLQPIRMPLMGQEFHRVLTDPSTISSTSCFTCYTINSSKHRCLLSTSNIAYMSHLSELQLALLTCTAAPSR